MSVFTVVSAANHFEIADLSDIKDELGLDGEQYDKQLAELIETCTSEVQDETHWQFSEKTLRLTLPMFPPSGLIPLRIKPVQSVSSITYYDTDNSSQTLAGSNYRLVTLTSPAQIEITASGTWPSTYNRGDAVQVNVVVGHDDLSEVPAQAKRAVKERVKLAFNGCGNEELANRMILGLKWFYDVYGCDDDVLYKHQAAY